MKQKFTGSVTLTIRNKMKAERKKTSEFIKTRPKVLNSAAPTMAPVGTRCNIDRELGAYYAGRL